VIGLYRNEIRALFDDIKVCLTQLNTDRIDMESNSVNVSAWNEMG